MRVTLEICFGIGGWSDKVVELASLPVVGQEMVLPLGQDGTDIRCKVNRVNGDSVSLSSLGEMDHRQLARQGWILHFTWPV